MDRIEEIAEEFAAIFDIMGWRWDTSTFKGIPDKKRIAEHIRRDIDILKDRGPGDFTASGRIFVLKHIDEEPEGDYVEYYVMLNDKMIGEESLIEGQK